MLIRPPLLSANTFFVLHLSTMFEKHKMYHIGVKRSIVDRRKKGNQDINTHSEVLLDIIKNLCICA